MAKVINSINEKDISRLIQIRTDEYVIDKQIINALKSLSSFGKNAFLGYGAGKESEIEECMYSAYEWLVSEYLELVVTIAEREKNDLENRFNNDL